MSLVAVLSEQKALEKTGALDGGRQIIGHTDLKISGSTLGRPFANSKNKHII